MSFRFRNDDIILTEGNTSFTRLFKTKAHDVVCEDHSLLLTTVTIDNVDQPLNGFLSQYFVDDRERHVSIFRQDLRNLHAPCRRLNNLANRLAIFIDRFPTRFNFGVQCHYTSIKSVFDLFDGTKDFSFAGLARFFHRDVIKPENNILRRNNDRLTVCWR